MKKCDNQDKIKKEYIKPEIKVQELTLHALLGENGWLPNSGSLISQCSGVPYPYNQYCCSGHPSYSGC